MHLLSWKDRQQNSSTVLTKQDLAERKGVRLPRRENFSRHTATTHLWARFESFSVTTSTLPQIKGSQTKGGTKLDRIWVGTKLPLLREPQPQLLL